MLRVKLKLILWFIVRLFFEDIAKGKEMCLCIQHLAFFISLFLGDIACNSWPKEHGRKGWAVAFQASGVGLWVSKVTFMKGGCCAFGGRTGKRWLTFDISQSSNYLITESSGDCVLLPFISEVPGLLWASLSLEL